MKRQLRAQRRRREKREETVREMAEAKRENDECVSERERRGERREDSQPIVFTFPSRWVEQYEPNAFNTVISHTQPSVISRSSAQERNRLEFLSVCCESLFVSSSDLLSLQPWIIIMARVKHLVLLLCTLGALLALADAANVDGGPKKGSSRSLLLSLLFRFLVFLCSCASDGEQNVISSV